MGINLRSNHFSHPLLIINSHHYNLQKESSIVTGPISGGLNLLRLLFVFKFAGSCLEVKGLLEIGFSSSTMGSGDRTLVVKFAWQNLYLAQGCGTFGGGMWLELYGMCMICAYLYVCMFMYEINTCMPMEINKQRWCQPSPSTLFETESVVHHSVRQASWPTTSRLPTSPQKSNSRAMCYHACLYVGSGGSNSGSYVSRVSALPTDTFPQILPSKPSL